MNDTTNQPLFSYGTLQLASVQIGTFGRLLEGKQDALSGFVQDWVEITDPQVLRASDQTHHPILRKTGLLADQVTGTVFQISPQELAAADSYEVDDYMRVKAQLTSGNWAWVYVAKET